MALAAGLIGAAHWFASLSWPAQALLAAAILTFVAQPWRTTLLELVRALRGGSP
jgi:hypothetical protein